MNMSSDSGESEELFPLDNRPPQEGSPGADLDTSHLLASELSPPQSQEPSDVMATAGDTDMVVENENGLRQNATLEQGLLESESTWEKSEFAKSAEMVHEPGAAWNNKKARDEYQRAAAQIEDRNFSLSEFYS